MRVRIVAVVSLATMVALAPVGALAKGAIKASISGPGIGAGIRLNGIGEPGSGTRLGDLAEQSGFFAQAYGMEPDPVLASRPTADLGPRYVVRYTMEPGDRSIVTQDVYPFARRGPVTFMPGEQTFYGTESTRGGWFRASTELRDTLIAIGLPRVRPQSSLSTASTTEEPKASEPRAVESSSTPWLLWALGAAVAVAIAGAGARKASRKHGEPAPVD
jgi:hypothetical protein